LEGWNNGRLEGWVDGRLGDIYNSLLVSWRGV
jgi:hypothetical protein